MKYSSISKIIKNYIDKFIRFIYRKNNGIYIFQKDWDNLIILDACRYDVFDKLANIQNENTILRKEISRGSHTADFLKENFKNKKYEDIVYITGNPFVDLLIKEKVYKVISVWKDGWNDEEKTVLPETMYNYTLKTIKKYPTKKFIIHFMQPHYPYIGFHMDNSFKKLKEIVLNNQKLDFEKKFKDPFNKCYESEIYSMIEERKLWKLYIHNFKLVLSYVEKLIKILPGKIVITADHGEALGDKINKWVPIKLYGHKIGYRIKPLVEIPWLEVPNKQFQIERDSYEKKLILKAREKFTE